MGEDRTKLLHSLSIERDGSKPAARGRARLPKLIAVLAVCSVAGAGAAWIAPQLAAGRTEQADPPPAPAASSPGAAAGAQSAAEAQGGGLSASGYVVARRKATVAAEITGKVVETMAEEGMVVEAGQVLARLDNVLATTDLALSESKVAAAAAAANAIAADLRDAERIFLRLQALSQKNFATEADLTKAEARVGVLRAQLAQAQAQLDTSRLDAQHNAAVLEKHNIRAPFGGVVVDRSAQPGEMISPLSAGGSFTRTGICTIVDMDSIEVEVDVNEAYIGRVKPGAPVDAVLDAYPDWTIPAAVIAIVPTANREKATVRVRIGFKQKDPRILPDMAVKVKFLDEGTAPGVASSH
jgi:RND family efflux transporter MFP subunit